MGRRPGAERPLLRMLESLRSGRAGSDAAFIYGPRSNGKTLLLN